MARRVRKHLRARIAVSDAIEELAFKIANDIFDQKWSRAGVNLLTASLAQLSSEAVHVNRQLETFDRGTQLDESLLTLFKELSKRPNGRALLKLQASATKDKVMAALFKKLASGQSRGVNLPDPSPARATSQRWRSYTCSWNCYSDVGDGTYHIQHCQSEPLFRRSGLQHLETDAR